MLIDSATRLFADHVDAKLLDAAKRDGWSPELWRIVAEAQLPLVSISEEAGGAGGSLSDLAAVPDIERNVPPVVGLRRQCQLHLADDLRPHMQVVVGGLPCFQRKRRPGFEIVCGSHIRPTIGCTAEER